MTHNPAKAIKNFTAVPGHHTGPVSKILIANRGEIAVRIIRAARDEGLETVAVYAEPDRDAQHVKLADEAYALGGATAPQSYLVMDKLIEVAIRSGADAVHPGYGFLSENAEFAQKVIDAGLTWIGPSPESITQLGDKVAARHIAQKVGAPLVPGTKDPVESADEVLAFADEHGLPIAIKAAFGGGGRGIKVVRNRSDIIELYESAVREAVAAYGRGECFIERFLDSPRHIETQCLADAHGNVQVVSTRDCSLQRRNQKLVEEAPAPYLTEEQSDRLYEASRKILQEAGYQGAGTCEFLLAPDGAISFLEVNTRLQVEHPVSEEVAGIDLVREQFRIARGEKIDPQSPQLRGHSFEFRINGEDAGRSFMPAPGTIRPRCTLGFRLRRRRCYQRQLRLNARQAHRDRCYPRAGDRTRSPSPRRAHTRRPSDGGSLPPRSSGRTRFRPRSRSRLQGSHPVDRNRLQEHHFALLRRSRQRG